MASLPREVTAWDLVADFGTGGLFQAHVPGGRVVWTDARANPDDSVVILGRVVPAGDRLRVLERRVAPDTKLVLTFGETTEEANARVDAAAEVEEARMMASIDDSSFEYQD